MKKMPIILLVVFLTVSAGLAFFFGIRGILGGDRVIGTSGSAGGTLNSSSESLFSEDASETEDQTFDRVVSYKGETYRYDQRLTNILILGIDLFEPFRGKCAPGEAGQSDFILLLSLNRETKEGRILEIHRNAMTRIDLYDSDGKNAGTMDGQVTLQYAYGIGGEQSCWAAKKTVSRLLYGLEIDGYLTISGGGIEKLTDAIGGVDVTISGDYTELNEAFVSGATVHMDGALAERYIHYRDIEVFDSATDRMRRQTDFILGLIRGLSGKDADVLYDTLDSFRGEWILTDLSAEELRELMRTHYETDEILTVPGETVMGEEYEEYYVDEEGLQQLIIDCFYVKR